MWTEIERRSELIYNIIYIYIYIYTHIGICTNI